MAAAVDARATLRFAALSGGVACAVAALSAERMRRPPFGLFDIAVAVAR